MTETLSLIITFIIGLSVPVFVVWVTSQINMQAAEIEKPTKPAHAHRHHRIRARLAH